MIWTQNLLWALALGPMGPFGSEGAIQPTLIAMMTSVVLTVLNIVQLPQCA